MFGQLLFLIEISILVYADFGFQGAVNETSLVFVGDEFVRIYFDPAYAFFGVDSQATLNEIFCVSRYVDFAVVRPVILYFFQNIVVIHSHIRILAVHHLVINDAN